MAFFPSNTDRLETNSCSWLLTRHDTIVHPCRLMVHVVLLPRSRTTTGVDAITMDKCDLVSGPLNYADGPRPGGSEEGGGSCTLLDSWLAAAAAAVRTQDAFLRHLIKWHRLAD